MNLKMIPPQNETDDSLLSITKNCETLVEQTHSKLEETLELLLTKPRETCCFKPVIPNERCWIMRITSLEVYNSIFNKTKEFNKFELYTDNFDLFSFAKLRDELEEFLDISNITSEHLQDKILEPPLISAYKKLETEKRRTYGYNMLSMRYGRSPVRDFESYLKIVVGLDAEDIRLYLRQDNSIFIKYEIEPGVYSIKDFSGAVYTMGDYERTLQIENDDISKKTKFI